MVLGLKAAESKNLSGIGLQLRGERGHPDLWRAGRGEPRDHEGWRAPQPWLTVNPDTPAAPGPVPRGGAARLLTALGYLQGLVAWSPPRIPLAHGQTEV